MAEAQRRVGSGKVLSARKEVEKALSLFPGDQEAEALIAQIDARLKKPPVRWTFEKIDSGALPEGWGGRVAPQSRQCSLDHSLCFAAESDVMRLQPGTLDLSARGCPR